MNMLFDDETAARRNYVKPEMDYIVLEEQDPFTDSSEFEDPDAGTWI